MPAINFVIVARQTNALNYRAAFQRGVGAFYLLVLDEGNVIAVFEFCAV